MIDQESTEKHEAWLRRHLPLIIVMTVLLAPPIWFLVDYVYKERIEKLKERINLCEDRLKIREDQLRSGTPERPVGVISPQPPHAAGGSASSIAAPTPSQQDKPAGRYPTLDSPDHPTQDDVRRLAEYYDLLKSRPTNPHLRFKTGDISYWREQGFSAADLEREFESRRLVLDRAEKSGTSIPSQGDLSHAAELLQSQMAKVGRPTSR